MILDLASSGSNPAILCYLKKLLCYNTINKKLDLIGFWQNTAVRYSNFCCQWLWIMVSPFNYSHVQKFKTTLIKVKVLLENNKTRANVISH